MVAGVLLPLFLAQFGFVRNVEQTPRAILGILLTFSLVPCAFAVLKAVAIWIYPLTQAKVDQIENDLGARRVATG
jgi:GPH family glycoside/pentoside/hexuronide:cation symporter